MASPIPPAPFHWKRHFQSICIFARTTEAVCGFPANWCPPQTALGRSYERCEVPSLALMDDFERIPVRVKYIGGVVSGVVFKTCAWRNIVPTTSGGCGP